MTIPNEDLKICTKCAQLKPLKEFYLKSNKRNYEATCRPCTMKIHREYMMRPHVKVKRAIYWRAVRAKTKAATFAAYGGNICACCGETERTFLTLDHINNDGAAFRKKNFSRRNYAGFHTYMWLMKRGFPDGYQVLCMNCQWGKKLNAGVCPHQVTRNDYPTLGVPASAGKRSLTDGEIQVKDIVCPADESGSSFIN